MTFTLLQRRPLWKRALRAPKVFWVAFRIGKGSGAPFWERVWVGWQHVKLLVGPDKFFPTTKR